MADLWIARPDGRLECPTHGSTFAKGETCGQCGPSIDVQDHLVVQLEDALRACDRELQAYLDRLVTEVKAGTRLRRRIAGADPPSAGLALAEAQACKTTVSAINAAIAETRRQREDLEAALYRALDRVNARRGAVH